MPANLARSTLLSFRSTKGFLTCLTMTNHRAIDPTIDLTIDPTVGPITKPA